MSVLIFTLNRVLSKGWVKKLAVITMYCGEGVAVEWDRQQSKKEWGVAGASKVGGKTELSFGHGIPAMFAGSSPVQENVWTYWMRILVIFCISRQTKSNSLIHKQACSHFPIPRNFQQTELGHHEYHRSHRYFFAATGNFSFWEKTHCAWNANA